MYCVSESEGSRAYTGTSAAQAAPNETNARMNRRAVLLTATILRFLSLKRIARRHDRLRSVPVQKQWMFIPLFASLASAVPPAAMVGGENIRIEFDQSMHSRVIARFNGKELPIGDFTPSEFITVDGKEVKDFTLTNQGMGQMGVQAFYVLTGAASSLTKQVSVTSPSPDMA